MCSGLFRLKTSETVPSDVDDEVWSWGLAGVGPDARRRGEAACLTDLGAEGEGQGLPKERHVHRNIL